MKKFLIILFLFLFCTPTYAFLFKKKEKPSLFLSSRDPKLTISYDEKINSEDVFKIGSKIYFLIYNPEGFKSNYIKCQIFKQDNNAHIGGYD